MSIDPGGPKERSAVMQLGVVLERRRIRHPWQEWRWQAISVIAFAPEIEAPRLLIADEAAGMTAWHANTLPLEVHRSETASYKYNLSGEQPQVYVVLRPGDGPEFPLWPWVLTVSPFEAEAYAAGGENRVDAVAMPEPVIAWLKAFVDRHHVDEPFYKRRRTGLDQRAGKLGAAAAGGGQGGDGE